MLVWDFENGSQLTFKRSAYHILEVCQWIVAAKGRKDCIPCLLAHGKMIRKFGEKTRFLGKARMDFHTITTDHDRRHRNVPGVFAEDVVNLLQDVGDLLKLLLQAPITEVPASFLVRRPIRLLTRFPAVLA